MLIHWQKLSNSCIMATNYLVILNQVCKNLIFKLKVRLFCSSMNVFVGIATNNSNLVITNVRPIHEGIYQCLAINLQGKGISQEIKVNVQCKQEF
jgi:hypothetical protein